MWPRARNSEAAEGRTRGDQLFEDFDHDGSNRVVVVVSIAGGAACFGAPTPSRSSGSGRSGSPQVGAAFSGLLYREGNGRTRHCTRTPHSMVLVEHLQAKSCRVEILCGQINSRTFARIGNVWLTGGPGGSLEPRVAVIEPCSSLPADCDFLCGFVRLVALCA